jgi:HlyD family secretion protein
MNIRSSICFLTVSAILVACGGKEEGVKPTVKPLIEAVYASGFVVSKDEYQIFPQVEGTVAEKLVEEGDAVKKGEPLYIIESGQHSHPKTSVTTLRCCKN